MPMPAASKVCFTITFNGGVHVRAFPAVNFPVMTSLYVIPVKTGIHKSVVIPISYLDSCLRRNDIKRGHHGKIYSKILLITLMVLIAGVSTPVFAGDTDPLFVNMTTKD